MKMSDGNEKDGEKKDATWPAEMFAQWMQDAGEEAVETQTELMQSMMGGRGGMNRLPSQLNAFSAGIGAFKARVQSGGRISIPDTEREALGIEDGDVVQTFIIPIKRGEKQ